MSAEQDAPEAHRGSPRSFGKYRLIASLGYGGMADVFLAVVVGPAGFNKLQVVKRLRPSLAEEEELRNMFFEEARLAARLHHKNVVQTNEVDVAEGQYYIAMEYLDGQPLSRLLRQHKSTLPVPVVARVVMDSLAGLHYAHDLKDYDGTPLGVVHRDVSPQNIFVTYAGETKIVDFGIAKAARRMIETQAGVIKGKLSYMAPEQAFATSAEVDRRADVFSMGVVLWEMLAGRRLWNNLGDPEIIAHLMQGDIPSIATVRPDTPAELARICDKSLSKAREDRFASAAEMRTEIDRLGVAASHEDVGELVEHLFREARAELQATIERQLGRIQRDSAVDVLSLATPPPSTSVVSRTPSSRKSAPPGPTTTSDTPAPSTITTRRSSTPIELRSEVFAGEAKGGKSKAPMIFAALLSLAAAGAVYLLVIDYRHDAKPFPARSANSADAPAPSVASGSAPEASTARAASSSAPAGSYVRVRVTANPTAARVLIDNNPLQNPLDERFIKDGAMHRIQIEANGFISQSRLVKFDQDIEITTSLQAKSKADGAGFPTKPDPY